MTITKPFAFFGVVAALSLASSALAARWIVPAAAHAAGVGGTSWRTDLDLANTGSASANVTLILLPASTDNSALARKVEVSVPAGGQVSLADVLDSKFAFSGSAGLLIDGSSDLLVASRTYNQNGTATFGQAIPAVPAEDALMKGETGHLTYLSKSDGFRSNVGFCAASAIAPKVTVTLLDAAGASLGSKTYDVLPFGQMQVNDIFASVGAAAAAVARAEVSTTAPVIVYASIVDNVTGDPIATIARHASEAFSETLIPAISHADGSGNSHWRSDVRIVNVSGATANLALSFYPINASTASPMTKSFSVAAGQTLALDDAALSVFEQSAGTGGVRVVADRPVHVMSRTFNDQAAAGTYGQDIPGVPVQRTFSAGDLIAFAGLTDGGFRANVGFFNGSTSAVPLTLTLKDSAGTVLASQGYTVAASSMAQINNVFGFLGVSGIPSATLAITSPTALADGINGGPGRGQLASYLSEVDQASGDPTFSEMALMRAANGASCRTLSMPHVNHTYTLSIDATSSAGQVTGKIVTKILEATQTRAKANAKTTTTAPGVGTITSDSTTTTTYELLDAPEGYLAVAKIETSFIVSGFTITTTATYTPAWTTGPALVWCEGETWVRAPVGMHLVASTGQSDDGITATGNGAVLGVYDTVTTTAGSFDTVHYTMQYTGSSSQAGTSSEVWLDEYGLTVKQVERDASGTVTATYERIPN